MSASWWRIQHNKHHSTPQKVGFDVDLNTLPLVAFTRKVVKRMGFPQRLWIRLQPVLFPVITNLLVAIGWQFYLHPRHALRTRNYRELVTMASRYALWHVFITSHFGLAHSTGKAVEHYYCYSIGSCMCQKLGCDTRTNYVLASRLLYIVPNLLYPRPNLWQACI
jgi:fatty acid desaturase